MKTAAAADNDGDIDAIRRRRPAAGEDPMKREQILAGARRVFIDGGFDAASMNDITREAGVSKGTIYVYFANKEELFEALIEKERGAIFSGLYEVFDQTDDLAETLTRFGVLLATKINSDPVIRAQRTVIGSCERIPDLGARFYERGPKLGHQRLTEFLGKAVADGKLAIPDTALAAYQFSDLIMAGIFRQRIFAYRAAPPSPEEIERTVRSGVALFLRGYAPKSSS